VDDVRIGEATDDLGDRVRLPDVGEELVAESLSLAGAADDSRDVDERHDGRDDPLAVEDVGESLQPRIGEAHDPDVRLDRRERVVRRDDLAAGQRVEEGGLADVGETDDADGESHGSRA
jgi:hypothetical protein